MTPTLADRIWRFFGRFLLVREMIDLRLYRAIRRDRGSVAHWLWRRAPHVHHPSQAEFNHALHMQAVHHLPLDGDRKVQDEALDVLRQLHQAGIWPNSTQPGRQTVLLGLCDSPAWWPLFEVARHMRVQRDEASLVFAVMCFHLDTVARDRGVREWFDEFQPDPLARVQFDHPTNPDGTSSDKVAVSVAERAFTYCDSEFLMHMLSSLDHAPAWALRGLVMRERPLSLEVVRALERMDIDWGRVLEEDFPNEPANQRLLALFSAIDPKVGDLAAMIKQARAMNAAQDQHDALQQATLPAGGRSGALRF